MLERARVKAESPSVHIPLIQLDKRDFSLPAGGASFVLIAAALFRRLRRPLARENRLRPAEQATLNRDAVPASARRRNLPSPSQACSIQLMEQQFIHFRTRRRV